MNINASLISLMNTIAMENPELLNMVMTDQVLIWTIKDLDCKLKEEYERYNTFKELLSQPIEPASEKEFKGELLKLSGKNLLSYYSLYKIYTKLKKARGLTIAFDTNIELIAELLKEEKLNDQESFNRA